eukprot:CAMPEP_0175749892 /NCGR_PEP_ID=MMETSP0097-20121207/60392_1 /TAXON_ID=311494 /ORGANISM="Alexandrium monilatum, Strain CCMP3105" /LENGTH=254 /DNA_ID=CAMNT_0017058477 /DNA_START=21 /DNA_END=782 /DNA_ORIENTATION=+
MLMDALGQGVPDGAADPQAPKRVGSHRTRPNVQLATRPRQEAAGGLEQLPVADCEPRVSVQDHDEAHEAPGFQDLRAKPPQQAALGPVEPGQEHRKGDERAVAERREVAAHALSRAEDDPAGIDLVARELVEDEDDPLGREEVKLVPEVAGYAPQDLAVEAVVRLALIGRSQAPPSHGVEDPRHVELRPELRAHDHEAEHPVVEALLDLHPRPGQRVQGDADLRVVEPRRAAPRAEDVVLHAPREGPPELPVAD